MIRFLVISAVLMLAGCASAPPQPLMSHGDPAVEVLNQSALRIARAAEQASLAESVKDASAPVTQEYGIDLGSVPQELRTPLLLEGGFHGELEVFLKSLTAAIGWEEPVVFGSRPPVPLMVVMTEQRRPPVYWIADAGYQAQDSAEVIVNVGLKSIVLTYKQPDGK